MSAYPNVWRCNLCGGNWSEEELLSGPDPFRPGEVLNGCPNCKQCAAGFTLLCDEPGCHSRAGCGWPTGDLKDQWNGYRWTCAQHASPFLKPVLPPPTR